MPRLERILTFQAPQACIIIVPIAASGHSEICVRAVNQPPLPASAEKVAEPDPARASSERGVVNGGGVGGLEAQLSTGHIGIVESPHLVTDGAPGLIDTHLHSALDDGGASHQSQSTSLTEHCGIGKKVKVGEIVMYRT